MTTLAMASKSDGKQRSPMRRFLAQYVWPRRAYLLQMIALAVLARLLALTVPKVLKVVFDYALRNRSFTFLSLTLAPPELLNAVLVLLVLFAVLGGLLVFRQRIVQTIAGQRLIFDLRFDLFHHLQTLSPGFYDRRSTGRVMSRLLSDIEAARELVSGVLVGPLIQVITLGLVLFLMFGESPKLALVATAVTPFYLYTFYSLSPKLREASRNVQQSKAIITGTIAERLSGIRVVQTFTRERTEEVRLFSQARELLRNILHKSALGGKLTALAQTITGLGTAVIIWYGGRQVLAGDMTSGGFIAFYSYVAMLYAPLQVLADVGEVYENSKASIERIFRLFDVRSEVVDRPDAVELTNPKGHVVLEDVTFGYDPRRPVLRHISLEARRGDRIALVGPSGSGKTTLANLLLRFYEPQQGRILLDGKDISSYTLASLRRHLGHVSQDPLLFSGTVAENILYGRRGATMQEVVAAAKAANAHDFIAQLPDGYDTQVGERGVRLSGGQIQRIAIARALLRDPAVLILDEATSSVDPVSEHLIQQALDRLMQGRTTFIIAHRLSTVVKATRIVVLDNGECVEQGTHSELLRRSGLYASLCREQLEPVGLEPAEEEALQEARFEQAGE